MTNYTTAELDVFLSDFAFAVDAATWGTSPDAIYEKEGRRFSQVSTVERYLTLKASDIPEVFRSGDLFTVSGENFKLKDVRFVGSGMAEVVLARTNGLLAGGTWNDAGAWEDDIPWRD